MDIQKVFSVTGYIILGLAGLVASTNQGALWRKLQISHSRLLGAPVRHGSYKIPINVLGRPFERTCSLSCQQIEWCNVWCPEPPSSSSSSSTTTTCLFFDMFVSPGYLETDQNDALDCYTRNEKDYAVGASITGAPAIYLFSDRVPEYLVDGIYLTSSTECYYSGDNYNPWFRLDLGGVKPIRKIRMFLQNTNYAEKFFDIEVRVGVHDVQEEDFAKNKFFGYFPGPSVANQEIVFVHDQPVMGQFVSVQRWSSQPVCAPPGQINGLCHLSVCHIEINP